MKKEQYINQLWSKCIATSVLAIDTFIDAQSAALKQENIADFSMADIINYKTITIGKMIEDSALNLIEEDYGIDSICVINGYFGTIDKSTMWKMVTNTSYKYFFVTDKTYQAVADAVYMYRTVDTCPFIIQVITESPYTVMADSYYDIERYVPPVKLSKIPTGKQVWPKGCYAISKMAGITVIDECGYIENNIVIDEDINNLDW